MSVARRAQVKRLRSSPYRPRTLYRGEIRRQRGKVLEIAAEFDPAAGAARAVRRLDRSHGALRFPLPPAVRRCPARGGRCAGAGARSGELSRQRAAAEGRRGRAGVQRARRRMARAACPGGQESRAAGRRSSSTREQTAPGDLHYLFSPLKHARLDYMVQKAVEMGVSRLQPVMMRHTQAERINLARMRANAIEAAEQCGILAIPEIAEPIKLDAFVRAWVAERLLVFCDEDADVKDPVAALSPARDRRPRGTAADQPAGRPRRRLRRGRARGVAETAEHHAARARAAHPARRYRRGRGARARSGGARRLALSGSALPRNGTKTSPRRFRSPHADRGLAQCRRDCAPLRAGFSRQIWKACVKGRTNPKSRHWHGRGGPCPTNTNSASRKNTFWSTPRPNRSRAKCRIRSSQSSSR